MYTWSSESVMTSKSSLTYWKTAPRDLKSGSFRRTLAMEVTISSVNNERNSMGWDAAFRKSIRTFALFSTYCFSLRAFALPFFGAFFPGLVSAESDGSSVRSMTVLRDLRRASLYSFFWSVVISHHSMRSNFLGRSPRTWIIGRQNWVGSWIGRRT